MDALLLSWMTYFTGETSKIKKTPKRKRRKGYAETEKKTVIHGLMHVLERTDRI